MEDNRCKHIDSAFQVHRDYAFLDPMTGATIEDAERMGRKKEQWDRVGDAMNILSTVLNGSNPKEVAKQMFYEVSKDHRTLQAQTVAAFIEFMSIYKDAAYDLRNKAAVEAATKITQLAKDVSLYIPLI